MADLALVVLMAVWGSTFAIVRVLVGSGSSPVSPSLLVAVRMAVAFALLLFSLALRGGIRLSRDLLRAGLVCAVFLGAGFVLQIEGQHRTTASRSGFLTGLLVVFVPLIELVFFKKRPSAPQIAGVVIAVLGMAVLSGGGAAGNAQLIGDLLTFGCAVGFAIHIVVLGRVAPRHEVLPLLLVQLGGTAPSRRSAGRSSRRRSSRPTRGRSPPSAISPSLRPCSPSACRPGRNASCRRSASRSSRPWSRFSRRSGQPSSSEKGFPRWSF